MPTASFVGDLGMGSADNAAVLKRQKEYTDLEASVEVRLSMAWNPPLTTSGQRRAAFVPCVIPHHIPRQPLGCLWADLRPSAAQR